jgi:hypothetical protein
MLEVPLNLILLRYRSDHVMLGSRPRFACLVSGRRAIRGSGSAMVTETLGKKFVSTNLVLGRRWGSDAEHNTESMGK